MTRKTGSCMLQLGEQQQRGFYLFYRIDNTIPPADWCVSPFLLLISIHFLFIKSRYSLFQRWEVKHLEGDDETFWKAVYFFEILAPV